MHIYYCQGSLKSPISVTGTFQDADLTSQKKKKKKEKKKRYFLGCSESSLVQQIFPFFEL